MLYNIVDNGILKVEDCSSSLNTGTVLHDKVERKKKKLYCAIKLLIWKIFDFTNTLSNCKENIRESSSLVSPSLCLRSELTRKP